MLSLALSACGTAIALGGIARQVGGAASTTTATTATDDSRTETVKQVIQRATSARREAFGPSPERGSECTPAGDALPGEPLVASRIRGTDGHLGDA